MTFVFRTETTRKYLRLTGGEPGDWEWVEDIRQATVFNAVLGDQFDKIQVKPLWPFSPDDYRDYHPNNVEMVAVRINQIEEV